MRSTVLRSLLALALFSILHSALAALPAKRRASALAGSRRTAGLYRICYVAQAAVSTALLAGYLWSLPDRLLYRVQGWPRAVMFAGQAIAATAIVAVGIQVGPAQFTGLPQLLDLLAGRPIRPVVVAQHPVPAGTNLEWSGPFRFSRHPNNYFPLMAWWLSPVMTVKWASVGLGAAVYMMLGSLHEERRLSLAYGQRFRHYQRQVPHLIDPFAIVPRGADLQRK